MNNFEHPAESIINTDFFFDGLACWGQLEVLKKTGQNVGLLRATYVKEKQIRRFYASPSNLVGTGF